MLSNKLNVNGSEIRLDESSVLPNMTVVPPAVELASTKEAAPGATFVLAAGAVTVKVGPVTDRPKTVTVIGPVDALYGTSTSMRVRDASAILTGIPLKSTPRLSMCESNSLPTSATRVPGGPLKGETLKICGGRPE